MSIMKTDLSLLVIVTCLYTADGQCGGPTAWQVHHHLHHHHHHYHEHQGVVFPPVKASQLAGASIAFITAPGNAFQGPISFADKLSISAAELPVAHK